MTLKTSLAVHLLTTHPHPAGACERLLTYSKHDRFGVHRVTDDPEEADMIVFVESIGAEMFLNAMRRHPLVGRFPEKCFCFCELDHQVSFLPGIYASLQKRWHSPARDAGGFYLAMYDNPYVTHMPARDDAPYLFSFVGDAGTHPVRQSILRLQHPGAKLIDTSQYCWDVRHKGSPEQRRAFEEDYARVLRDSRFVLCPRGWSPSSVRLFETLKAGRVPVIISDQWTPPAGPDWQGCSICVSESEVACIPALLESLAPNSAQMGEAARNVYEQWFAPDVCFHRIVEWCRGIDASRSPMTRRLATTALPLRQIIQIGRTGLFIKDTLRTIRNSLFPFKV